MPKKKDLTGIRFGRLVVTREAEPKYTSGGNRNLRVVTRSQNGKNKTKSKKNTSGCTGVVWHKRDKIWEVSIKVDNKYIYLGRYENKEDAINARIEAERQYYGQYSYTVSQEIARENNIIK